MEVINELFPKTDEQRRSFGEPGPEGPVVMVNLFKFRERAAYADGSDHGLSGREAFGLYHEVMEKHVVENGGRVLYHGDVSLLSVGQVENLWDEVAIAEFPSRAAFVELTSSPVFQSVAHHRTAGLEGQLNIETIHRPGSLSVTEPR